MVFRECLLFLQLSSCNQQNTVKNIVHIYTLQDQHYLHLLLQKMITQGKAPVHVHVVYKINITCVSYSEGKLTQVESQCRAELCQYMLPPLHQQETQFV